MRAHLVAVNPASGLLQVELFWDAQDAPPAGLARHEIPAAGVTAQSGNASSYTVAVSGDGSTSVGWSGGQAYKIVGAVVDAADAAGLARKVARMAPMICIKG